MVQDSGRCSSSERRTGLMAEKYYFRVCIFARSGARIATPVVGTIGLFCRRQ